MHRIDHARFVFRAATCSDCMQGLQLAVLKGLGKNKNRAGDRNRQRGGK
jgi:hypothetical protein